MNEDKLKALEYVKKDGMVLKNAIQFQDDFDVCLEAVKQNQNAYRFISPKLKNSHEFRKKIL